MKQRLVYLDNIKVFLIAYVITGHIATSYGAIGGGKWSYIEAATDFTTKAILSLYILVAYAFLMGMFIYISGYFTLPSLKKKGAVVFIKERLFRLGIPLVIYYFLIGPLVRYISKSSRGFEGNFPEFLQASYSTGTYGNFGVMWFVVLILFFSVIYAVFFHFFPEGLFKSKSNSFPSAIKILILVIIAGTASYLSRIAFPLGSDMAGSRPLGSMIFFSVSFFLGTASYRYGWLDKLNVSAAKPWIITAILVMLLTVFLLFKLDGNIDSKLVSKPGSIQSLLYSFWEILKTLGTGMLAVLVFRKYLNKPGKISDILGRSVFLAFYIHPLVCVLWQYLFSDMAIQPLFKFFIIAPVALISTFTLAWLLLKIPFVRRIM
jgi:glucans biosynthesis protein C